MARYTTHTDPPLELIWEDGKVVLRGDNEKLLYPLEGKPYVFGEASKTFFGVKAHYEARRKVEVGD